MFVTFNQINFFLLCVAFGILSGVIYEIFYVLTFAFKNQTINGVRDFLFFACLSVLFLFYSVKLSFPNLRVYLCAGVVTGFFFYVKSFHKVVAFFINKSYNFIIRKIKLAKKVKYNDKRKKRKDVKGGGVDCDSNVSIVFEYSNISSDKNRRKKKRAV